MRGSCKLCGEEKDLCRSHIIPEFFYDKIYDIKPKRFWFFQITTKEVYKKQEQKGLRERLLCKSCEKEFSVYEKYAAEIIYAKNQRSAVILENRSGNSNVIVNEYKGFEYHKFKLFLISILWRISISSEKFSIVEISEEHQSRLHESLLNKSPLDFNEYPCIIQTILHADNSYFRGSIIGPYETYLNNEYQVINILIDGNLFSFIIGQPNLNEEIQKLLLNEQGEMTILTKKVQSDPNLMEAIRLIIDRQL